MNKKLMKLIFKILLKKGYVLYKLTEKNKKDKIECDKNKEDEFICCQCSCDMCIYEIIQCIEMED